MLRRNVHEHGPIIAAVLLMCGFLAAGLGLFVAACCCAGAGAAALYVVGAVAPPTRSD